MARRTPEQIEHVLDAVGEVLHRQGHDLSEDAAAELVSDTVQAILEAEGT